MVYLFVFCGGGLGSCLRFLLLNQTAKLGLSSTWPATLIVNTIGSLLFLWLVKSASVASEELKTFVKVGVLGGLTTFSSLSFEVFSLFKAQDYLQAVVVLILNILFGIIVGIGLFK